jgi:hypothetical protein
MNRTRRGWRRGATALFLAAVTIVVPAAAQAANQLPNPGFEGTGSGSLAGWQGQTATLSLASPGHTGSFAARATASGSSPIIKTTKITVPDGTYVANGWGRTLTTGKVLCLRITEYNGTTNVGNTQLCNPASTSTGWSALPQVSRTVSGTAVSVMVLQKNSTAGQQFEIDDMSLDTQAGGGTVPAPPTNLSATATTATSVSLTWTASSGATSYNVYRATGTSPPAANATPRATGVTGTSFTDNTVAASTTYTYQVTAVNAAGESGRSNADTVTTPAGGGGGTVTGPKVAAAGDIVCEQTGTCLNRAMSTSNLILGQGYTAALALGDNQYECGSLSSYNNFYDGTWGRLNSIVHPIPGDNDWVTTGGINCPTTPGDGYFDYYGAHGVQVGARGQGYYSFTVGSWKLIALNGVCTTVSCSASSPMITFLRQQLQNSPQCTLIYSHVPRYSSAGAASLSKTAQIWDAALDFHADLILSGNAHVYNRFVPQDLNGNATATGVTQYIVGTGGKSSGTRKSNPPNEAFLDDVNFGVLDLTLGDGAWSSKFRTTGGAVLDQHTQNCVP